MEETYTFGGMPKLNSFCGLVSIEAIYFPSQIKFSGVDTGGPLFQKRSLPLFLIVVPPQPDHEHGNIGGRDARYTGCLAQGAGPLAVKLLASLDTQGIHGKVGGILGEESVFHGP